VHVPLLARLRPSGLVLLAVLLPLLLLTGYLTLTRMVIKLESSVGDWFALVAAVAVGVPPVWHLARRGPSAMLVIVGYALAAGIVLASYSLWFVCGAFGDCL
jgi:hypothetical protein